MQQKTKLLLTVSLVSVYLAIFFSIQVFGSSENKLQVSFLDIGQGDAIYIKAPNGSDMLIDGGRTTGVITKKLKGAMTPGDNNIDVVLATHPDADHIGGLPYVLENYTVGSFIDTGIQVKTKIFGDLETLILEKEIPHIYAKTGTVVVLDKENNIKFEIFAPFEVNEKDEPNDVSIVGLLTYKEQTFLLTGDAPTKVEDIIIENFSKNIENIDVLKLGHHGSKTSSGENFLKVTNPKISVISAGCQNSYGHPSKEIVSRLLSMNLQTISTCESGTITFLTDGLSLITKQEK